MPISKKRKHPQKRKKRTTSTPFYHGGNITIIDTIEKPTAQELGAFHLLGMSYYNQGKADKADGKAAMSLKAFKDKYDKHEREFDDIKDFCDAISQGHYRQYIDGYTGADYNDIVFNEVNLFARTKKNSH